MRTPAAVLALILASGCPQPPVRRVPVLPEDPPPRAVHPTPGDAPPKAILDVGPTVQAEGRVLPLSGGTLLVLNDQSLALAADPDRDALHLVDLERHLALPSLVLQAGDEPGRAVEDSSGLVHVVLRGGGALLTLRRQGSGLEIIARRPVCRAPRGVAYDARADLVHVACADGPLVSLPAAGGLPTQDLDLGLDLRDVVVSDGVIYVSRFRSAEVVRVVGREVTTIPVRATGWNVTPAVAWRLRPLSGGRAVMVHEMLQDGPVQTETPGGYGGLHPCMQVALSAVTVIDRDGHTSNLAVEQAPLLVDLALAEDGQTAFAVAAGNAHRSDAAPQVLRLHLEALSRTDGAGPPIAGGCSLMPSDRPQDLLADAVASVGGDAVAVAMTSDGHPVVQLREPAALVFFDGDVVPLAADHRADTGYTVFHGGPSSNAGLACASCHPEGGEDGHVWNFSEPGPRRTQSLRSGVVAPFLWNGDLASMSALMTTVFTGRMSGPTLPADANQALTHWLATLRPLPGAPTSDAAQRGGALFADAKVGCASCHSGPTFTNHAVVAVGTAGTFKTPSLTGVRWRAPYLHDGCAPTLTARFGPCGGRDLHGVTSTLTPAQIDDLVAYLETL